MTQSNRHRPGRHFLQIPGPSNVPDRVLRAIDQPTIDHRGPEFAAFGLSLFERLKPVFGGGEHVFIYASSGSGAWEAALVNTLNPGDKVLMFETGQFADLWHKMATRMGLEVDWVPGDWRHPVDPGLVEAKLAEDKGHKIKAVMAVHNETSTGAVSDIAAIRKAIDAAKHPALFMVDTISSLGSIDYRHDDWQVDVTVGGSQKGMMLPPGLGFNAVSKKALKASETAKLPRSFWAWDSLLAANKTGSFPYTPATNMLFGLDAAIDMLMEEGLQNVYARHNRLAEATRRALAVWGLENQCLDPKAYSSTVTAVRVPDGQDADILRGVILDRFNMSLGAGLGKVAKKVFRIGHLGDFNELMLMGALCGVEMGLDLAGVPHKSGGADAAMKYLARPEKG